MKRFLVRGILPLLLFVCLSLMVQAQVRAPAAQGSLEHVITVSRSGTAFAKPDVGILIMSIQAVAPIAEDAVSADAREAKSVQSALVALGYSPDRYKLSPVVLGGTGGVQYGPYQPAVTGVVASRYVYVFFDGPQLNDLAQLTGTAATAIEALRKAGAAPANVPGSFRTPGQMAMIIYAVKDSEKWENQALQQAVERARGAAQAIAAQLQVQITGVRSVTASYLGGRYMPNSGLAQLKGLPYSFFSTRSDEVEIRANATVYYDFK